MTLRELELDQIVQHPNNPRRDVGDVTELAASIEAQGLLEPLIVTGPETTGGICLTCDRPVLTVITETGVVLAEHPKQVRAGMTKVACKGSRQPVEQVRDYGHVLIAGHRRLAAARQAGLATVPCIVRSELTDPAAQLEAMLVENLQRVDLTPVEEAAAYQQLLEFPGYTVAKIRTTTGRSRATINARLNLAKLDEKTRERVHAGQVTIDQANAIVKYSADPKAVDQLTRAAGTGEWKWTLAQVQSRIESERKEAKLRAKLEADGITIATKALGWGAEREKVWFQAWHAQTDQSDQHRGHDGFRAYLSGGGNVEYWCTDDACAPAAGDITVRRVETPEQTARRELDERRTVDLQTAATVRRAHLAAVISHAADGYALEYLRNKANDEFKHCNHRPYALQILGMDLIVDETPVASAARARKRIDKLTAGPLATFIELVQFSSADHNLTSRWRDGWGGSPTYDPTKKWREKLTGHLGYEWTPIEREMLDASRPVPAVVDTKDIAEYESIAEPACTVCGCTTDDCSECIGVLGYPCAWADDEESICTRCAEENAAVSA